MCRGDLIVPSFDEMFPGLRKDDHLDGTSRKKFIGQDYYKDAMEVGLETIVMLFCFCMALTLNQYKK